MTQDSAIEPDDLHQVKKTWSPFDQLSSGARARLRRLWSGLGFNPLTASALRYEFDMVLLRARCALSPSHRRQVSELANGRSLLVHLGCGNALFPGWVNVDCYPPATRPGAKVITLDMRRGLPFASQTVAAIFTEHFLEHLPVTTVAQVILPEMRRILEPGGRVRIGVPDGEYFVNKYVEYRAGQVDPLFEQHRRGLSPMTMLNEIAHGFGHHFAYDFATMKAMLEASGFGEVHRTDAGVTTAPVFQGRDRIDEWRQAMSLYVEATAAA